MLERKVEIEDEGEIVADESGVTEDFTRASYRSVAIIRNSLSLLLIGDDDQLSILLLLRINGDGSRRALLLLLLVLLLIAVQSCEKSVNDCGIKV